MANLIEVENLSRYYGKYCAVNNISFTLAKGEVVGFLGPNGAGKTTTMQMLSGNLAPSSGLIKINGFDLLNAPLKANLAWAIYLIFHHYIKTLLCRSFYITALNYRVLLSKLFTQSSTKQWSAVVYKQYPSA